MTTLPTIKDYYKQYDLNISCYQCNRNAVADWDLLAERFDMDLPIKSLEKKYICKDCNSSDAVRIRLGLKVAPSGAYPNHS